MQESFQLSFFLILLKDQHFPVVIPSFVHLTEQRGSGGGSWGIEEFFTSKISSKETLAKVSLSTSHSPRPSLSLNVWIPLSSSCFNSLTPPLPSPTLPSPPLPSPQVPSLNSTPLDHLHNGCLVRYRCMVQDQFNPEFYLKLYHTTNTQTGHTVSSAPHFTKTQLSFMREMWFSIFYFSVQTPTTRLPTSSVKVASYPGMV